MNLSTSSFSYKKRLLLLLFLTLAFYLLINSISFQLDDKLRLSRENNYVYPPDTKGNFALMKQLFLDSNPDIVFIGNSMTILHVDTHLFYKANIKTFNYATVGYFIAQYPEMIENAIKINPKIIAISVRKNDFYNPPFFHYKPNRLSKLNYPNTATYQDLHKDLADLVYDSENGITTEDLYFLIKHTPARLQAQLFSHFIIGYLKNYNYFLSNGYAVTQNIVNISQQISGGTPLAEMVNQLVGGVTKETITLDCDFDAKGNRIPQNCYNRDYVIVDHKTSNDLTDYRKEIILENSAFDYHFIEILNGLLDQVTRAGIQPVLIIEPNFYNYKADNNLISNNVHAKIIDLSDMKLSKDNFADRAHYNMAGRHKFSLGLINKIKPLLNKGRTL